MHGGKSPGAPKGNRNAWKHGHYSQAAKAERFLVKRLLKDATSVREYVTKPLAQAASNSSLSTVPSLSGSANLKFTM
jgi:hypothetical protein